MSVTTQQRAGGLHLRSLGGIDVELADGVLTLSARNRAGRFRMADFGAVKATPDTVAGALGVPGMVAATQAGDLSAAASSVKVVKYHEASRLRNGYLRLQFPQRTKPVEVVWKRKDRERFHALVSALNPA